MLFAFTGTAFVSRPTSFAFKKAMHQVLRLPQSARYIASVIILLAIVLAVSLGLPESSGNKRINRMQSFLGIIFILALLVLTSKNRSQIQWRTVIVGFLLQFCLGCVVVKTKWGTDFFTWLATIASSLLEFARYGTKFLFGDDVGGSAIFAVSVFPAIIFFSAFIQMTTYLGGAQWLLRNLGWLFLKMLNTSGVESIVAAASPFFGQSENVLLVKDYLEHMTKSEIHACMTAGFATISGSTLQGYIVLGVNAANIITACIMSIPCSLALSKIRYPETEVPLTRGKIVEPPRCTSEVNIIHAISSGAALGMNLSLLIAANLIAIIALVNLADFFFTWFGQFIAINNLTLELILGYILYPYTWLLGVSNKDVLLVSQLLGLKFVANEFVAYQRLTDESKGPSISSQLTDRSRVIAEFALCGFGNLGGIAQQIGAFGALAPSRKADFSQLALSACITGSIATTITAAIISMVM
ncbi:hypothetical protein GGI25_000420 [Coemansia spiralis]|uniref:Uncharacterized protein n=2 Tax=Coemansia TaxID=4863 RepID=A0A9W8KZH3_9FUNG|nr:hypothetical protein EDC05_000247 [Coemansia umbellata]KAJ2624179.1 hypothetical protein GGI26_001755 [Coemansia sp. RSA 1358]KAJ2680785.1 hypothetical protein GGI25_000420 [Coemansia spiralis]